MTTETETPATTSRKATIAGFEFIIKTPYAAGHVLKANEANALNQTLVENIRNNMTPLVKASTAADSKEPLNLEQLQEKIDTYTDAYEFGAGRATGNSIPRDPVAKQAMALARKAVDAFLKSQDPVIEKSALPEGKYDELVSTVAAKPETIAQAKVLVEAIQAAKIDVSGISI